jgi:CBS domain-containing protein
MAQRRRLETLHVKAEMSKPPIIVSPEATIKEAVRLMLEKKIGCLPDVSWGMRDDRRRFLRSSASR